MTIDCILFASSLDAHSDFTEARADLFEGLRAFADLNLIYPDKNGYFKDFKRENNDPEDILNFSEPNIVVCFIGTGGTEEMFINNFNKIPQPIVLLSDGFHNSLAASFEIASWLDNKGIQNEMINIPVENADWESIRNTLSYYHVKQLLGGDMFDSKPAPCVHETRDTSDQSAHISGQNDTVHTSLQDGSACELHQSESESDTIEQWSLYQNPTLSEWFKGKRIGLIGGESSWLISSGIDKEYISEKLGVKFIELGINEVLDYYNGQIDDSFDDLVKAEAMYKSILSVSVKHSLDALTIKCFDLLPVCNTTSCLALAKLNDMDIVAGCEGDIPSLFSMMAVKAALDKPSFMSNPSSADRGSLTVDFAHCTIPLTMTESHTFPTHFESDKSIGIAGIMPLGKYQLLKYGGEHLQKIFYASGEIIANTNYAKRCRTQITFKFSTEEDFDRFMCNRTGNHIVIF